MLTSTLLASDRLQSTVAALAFANPRPIAYMAYGYTDLSGYPRLGFTGQPPEQRGRWYLLGNGARMYSTVLMRFYSPDWGFSPFSHGGINSYGYAHGNPVTYHDRSGHVPETTNSTEVGSSSVGSYAAQATSYGLAGVTVANATQLAIRMLRNGIVPAPWMMVSMGAAFAGGGFALAAQGVGDANGSSEMASLLWTAANGLSITSVLAGMVQGNLDVSAESRRLVEVNHLMTANNWVENSSPDARSLQDMSGSQSTRSRSRSSSPEQNALMGAPHRSVSVSPSQGSRSSQTSQSKDFVKFNRLDSVRSQRSIKRV